MFKKTKQAKQAAAAPPVAVLLERLRSRCPLVQNITNWVAMDLSANLLLAAGASPAMVHAPEEAAEFAALAQAVVVNIGTFEAGWLEPALAAVRVAREHGTPWTLDPVAVGATAFRNEVSAALLAEKPDLVRANGSEMIACARLLGREAEGQGGRGVDSRDAAETAVAAASFVARATGGVALVSGSCDFASDGARVWRITGGDAILTQITATGCALSAFAGAFLAAAKPAADVVPAEAEIAPLEAAAAASACFSYAAERALADARGPGTFRAALLDALAFAEPHPLQRYAAARCEVSSAPQ